MTTIAFSLVVTSLFSCSKATTEDDSSSDSSSTASGAMQTLLLGQDARAALDEWPASAFEAANSGAGADILVCRSLCRSLMAIELKFQFPVPGSLSANPAKIKIDVPGPKR